MNRYSDINWTLADQSIVSGANFLISILVARFLGIEAFGVYSVILIVIWFVESLQKAVIISPMLSLVAKYAVPNRDAYFSAVFVAQLVFTISSALLVAIGAVLMDKPSTDLIPPLVTLMLVKQLHEYMRQSFYARVWPRLAFLVDSLNYGLSFIGLLILYMWADSTLLSSTLWLMAGAFLVASTVGALFQGQREWRPRMLREVLARHWAVGKWLIASSVVSDAGRNVFLLIASSVLGPAAIGAVRATQNVIGILIAIERALSNLIPVRAAHHYLAGGPKALGGYLRKVVPVILGATASIIAIACLAPEFWLSLLYGDKYEGYAYLIYWHSFNWLIWAPIVALGSGLRALEDTRPIFVGAVFNAAFSILTAHWFASKFGLAGIMFGNTCMNLVMLFVLSISLSSRLRSARMSLRTAA